MTLLAGPDPVSALPTRLHSKLAPAVPAQQPARDRLGFRDPSDFDDLLRPHLPRLIRAARGFFRSEDLAWDAVQETLVRLWLRGWIPADPAHAERALVHLLLRSCLHQMRCMRRRRHHESGAAEGHEPCCEVDPLLGLLGRELGDSIRSALAELSAEYREVFQLHELEGASYQDIAERLAVPVGTVRSRLNRARRQMRDRLTRVA